MAILPVFSIFLTSAPLKEPFRFLFFLSFNQHYSPYPPLESQNPSVLYYIYNPQQCPAITPTSSCAESNPASQSAASATNATASAPSATRMCGLQRSCGSATSAPLGITRISASCVVARGSVMRFTASSVRGWRRIGMGVRRL